MPGGRQDVCYFYPQERTESRLGFPPPAMSGYYAGPNSRASSRASSRMDAMSQNPYTHRASSRMAGTHRGPYAAESMRSSSRMAGMSQALHGVGSIRRSSRTASMPQDPFSAPAGRTSSRMPGTQRDPFSVTPLRASSRTANTPRDPFAPRPSNRPRTQSISGPRVQELPDDFPGARVPGRLSAAALRGNIPAGQSRMTPATPLRNQSQSLSALRRPSMSGYSRRPSIQESPTPARRSWDPYGMPQLTHAMGGMRVDRPPSPGIDRFHALRITTSSGVTVEYAGSTHTRGFERFPHHSQPQISRRHGGDVYYW